MSFPTDIHTIIPTAAAPSHITAHDWVAWPQDHKCRSAAVTKAAFVSSCYAHMHAFQSLTLYVCIVSKVMHLVSPNGAILDDWANFACDQHSFSEASHVNLQVHDDSAAGDPERGTVCSLVNLGLSQVTTTSDQDPLCNVNSFPACRCLSHLALRQVNHTLSRYG